MKKTIGHKSSFSSSYFVTGIGTIVLAILVSLYIVNKSKTFKEIPLDQRITDSSFYGPTGRPDWHTIDVGPFSIETPNTYKYTKLGGIDSRVGRIDNEMDTMYFDFGLYSYDFADEKGDLNFDIQPVNISGRLFAIVQRKDGLGLLGTYTSDLPDEHRLNIICRNCDSPEIIIEMFKTIKFRK